MKISLKCRLIDALVPLQHYSPVKSIIALLSEKNQDNSDKIEIPPHDHYRVLIYIFMLCSQIPHLATDPENRLLKSLALGCISHLNHALVAAETAEMILKTTSFQSPQSKL